jgi:hypothetical protein
MPQLPLNTGITSCVARELGTPEYGIGLRAIRQSAPAMAVPEASVNKDDRSKAWKGEIGHPRQIPAVKAESKPQAMCQSADNNLGAGTGRSDAGHQFRTLLRGQNVHQAGGRGE